MAKGLTHKKYSIIRKDAEKVAALIKVLTRPLSIKIMIALREARKPLLWGEIHRIVGGSYYNLQALDSLYEFNLIEPVELSETRQRGWALTSDLIIFLLNILEYQSKLPKKTTYEVLKFEKKSKELEKAVQRKHIQDEIIKKAQIIKDSGDIEGYDVLMRLLAENVF